MEKKECFRCNKVKSLDEFYKHKQMVDGHLNKCKDCTKSDTKKRHDVLATDPEWNDQEKKRHRDKYYRLGYKEKHKPTKEDKKAITGRYIDKFPEKDISRRKMGRLKPKVAGNHLHHWSYNPGHEFDIIELSPKNHYKAHRFMVYDQERMMYRNLDGVLLDTRESHFDYIMDKIKKEQD